MASASFHTYLLFALTAMHSTFKDTCVSLYWCDWYSLLHRLQKIFYIFWSATSIISNYNFFVNSKQEAYWCGSLTACKTKHRSYSCDYIRSDTCLGSVAWLFTNLFAGTIPVAYTSNSALYFFNETYLRKNAAQRHCHAIGGFLAVVRNMEIQTVINNVIKPWIIAAEKYATRRQSGNYFLSGFYIGGSLDEKNNLRWDDGSSVNYTNWFSGEPSHSTENCVIIAASNKTKFTKEVGFFGKWLDFACSFKLKFICQIGQ